MKITILSKKEDLFFGRTNVEFEVWHETLPTPKRDDVRAALAKEFDKDIKNIILISFKTAYGSNKSKGTVHVYEKEESIAKAEPKYVIKRNSQKVEKKEGEESTEEPKKEEKKQEKKE